MDIPYGVYVDNEPIKYYTFKKNVFKYKKKSMGYISIKGKGEYKIVRDSLFLNFNRTKLQKRSYYKYSTYDDCKDSITVKVKMLDYNGNSFSSSELENFLVSADKKFATKKDDYFYCKFKKDENEFVVIDVVGANEKYYPCEIVLRPRLSYVISVYMFKGKSHNMLNFLPIELKNCACKNNNKLLGIGKYLGVTEAESLFLANKKQDELRKKICKFLKENDYSDEARQFAKNVVKAKKENEYTNLFKLKVFNHNPYNVWKSLTEEEKKLIIIFPYHAYAIFKNRPIAEAETIRVYGRNGLNDHSDAFRHSFFNAKNAFSVGYYIAELFSNAHESETPKRWIKEKNMDLFNNNVGLNFVYDTPIDIDNIDLSLKIQKKIKEGKMRYLKPIDLNDPNFNYTHGINSITTLTPTNK